MVAFVDGGITAPKGYTAAGVSCGIKKDGQKDLAIVCSEDISAVAGVFTSNRIKGHSIKLTMEHIKSGYAKAVVINSGNANAGLGEKGDLDAKEITTFLAPLIDCEPEDILLGSTGIIGVPLNMPHIKNGLRNCVNELSVDGSIDAAKAIMTNDTIIKEVAVELELQEEKIRIAGMAKGSGTIHPNMATMIAIITTDVNISKGLLQKALTSAVNKSFNRISVDGETSVCDMVLAFANGVAENSGIVKESFEYDNFAEALETVCTVLAKSVAKDGEGATKLIEINVETAINEDVAKKMCKCISSSLLVKSAIFGESTDWGGILTAIGNSEVDFDPNLIDISLGNISVCKNGSAVSFDPLLAKKTLQSKEVKINVSLKKGIASYKLWTCDISPDYIKINSK